VAGIGTRPTSEGIPATVAGSKKLGQFCAVSSTHKGTYYAQGLRYRIQMQDSLRVALSVAGPGLSSESQLNKEGPPRKVNLPGRTGPPICGP